MTEQSYKVTVPGSCMLFGEHAVLHGKRAIVCAINKYLTATLLPRSDKQINIISAALGKHTLSLNNFNNAAPYEFIKTAIATQLTIIKTGFDLTIHSPNLPHNVGLGSSAAITVATLELLSKWLHLHNSTSDKKQLFLTAKKVIQQVQGIGSGADTAASVFGGIIVYQMEQDNFEKITVDLPLTLIYSGNKVPTTTVIGKVEAKRQQFPAIFADIFATIDSCSNAAATAIKAQDYQTLGEIMNIHQGLQDAMGINNSALQEIIFALRQHQEIYGAKISGSGLGDCVIGLGKIPSTAFPGKVIAIEVSLEGVR